MKRFFLPFLSLLSASVFTIVSEKYLGVEHGLSNNFVLGAAEDKNGFIWFATEEGLNRFDGNQFIPYYKHSSEKLRLTGNELNAVYADKEEPVI